MPEDLVDGEDDDGDDDDEVVESSQHTDFPDSQDLFITLTEILSLPSQGGILDREAREGTSAANVSSLPLASPSQRLSQIRRRKKRTHDEMFSELMHSSHNEIAQQNVWRDTIAQYRKAGSECEDRRDEREDRRDARDERWWQEDQRGHEAMLGLLQDQTDMLRRLVEVLQERKQDDRPPLQPMCNCPHSSPSPIASSPRAEAGVQNK
ncbi:uncharacterized protein RBU57_003001 [Macrochelys suwanniensis]